MACMKVGFTMYFISLQQPVLFVPKCIFMGWAGPGWVGLGWVGLGWVGVGVEQPRKHYSSHIVFLFFFYLDFMALSRIFLLYRVDCSSKVGKNRRTHGKKHLTLAFPHDPSKARTTAVRNLMD